MTPAVRRLARLWYGTTPVEAIARELGMTDIEVRYQALAVHRLGPRDPGDETWAKLFGNRDAVPDRRRELAEEAL